MEGFRDYEVKSKKLKELANYVCGLFLVLSPVACVENTPDNIEDQGHRVETLGHKIRSYRNIRNYWAKKYNKSLNVPQTKSNKNALRKVKWDFYNRVLFYDKKIEDLVGERVRAQENENIINAECVEFLPTTPLDTTTWDSILLLLDD